MATKAIVDSHHAVQFYGADQNLCTTVADFLAEGFITGQPAVLIATATHADAIVEHLSDRLIDSERAIRCGELILLDAERRSTSSWSETARTKVSRTA